MGPNLDFGNRKRIVELRGRIEPGDADRLEKFFRRSVTKIDETYNDIAISLDSRGGDFAEGLKIANFIYDFGLGTLVRAGDTCASACALAFLAGSQQEEGGPYVDRMIEVGAKLQFHAPYIDDETITTNKAELLRQLTNINFELMESLTHQYRVPARVVRTLFPNDEQHSLYTVDTVQMLAALRIDVYGLYQPQRLTLEMATNLCVNSNANPLKDGVPDPMEIEFEQSRKIQRERRVLKRTTDEVAIPVALWGENEDANFHYCIVDRSKPDNRYFCPRVSSSNYYEVKAGSDLAVADGEPCEIDARPDELLVVPVTTKLQNYASVVQKMEARGQSVFDLASIPAAAAPNPVKPSQGGGQGFICNNRADFVNLRQGPNSKTYAVVAKLPNNTRVKVLEETSNPESGHPWLKISAKGKKGFVDSELVSSEKCGETIASNAGTGMGFTPGKAFICNSEASFANMRSGPGPANDIVAALNNNTPVKKLESAVNEETQHPWLKIQAKGKTGYVDAEKVATTCDYVP